MFFSRLKDPFLAFSFGTGVLLWSMAIWIGLGIMQNWPGYKGGDHGGGIIVAVTLGMIGLLLIGLAFRPGWKE